MKRILIAAAAGMLGLPLLVLAAPDAHAVPQCDALPMQFQRDECNTIVQHSTSGAGAAPLTGIYAPCNQYQLGLDRSRCVDNIAAGRPPGDGI